MSQNPVSPVLEMREITKHFPGVQALSGVSFSVLAGEVHALVGENGAGKSTLMKILAGAESADGGEILIDGRIVRVDGPRTAERLGIGMIYQELNLVPALDAVDNIVLGNEPTNGLLLDRRAAERIASDALTELGAVIPRGVAAERLSVAAQQLVEIAKALSRRARVLVMDEPTAALTDTEVTALFATIAQLVKRGVAVVYISHRLEELPRIAQRITVLRDGKNVGTKPIADMPENEMIRLMVGRTLDAHFPDLPPVAPDAPVVFEVRDLVRSPAVAGVSLQVRAGEILGFAGLVGSGRTEIVRALAGADLPDSGTILLDGRPVRIHDPRSAISAGIALITDDRKRLGLVLGMSVRKNVTLAHLERFSDHWFIDRSKEVATTNQMIQELHIRTPGPEQLARNLSGGTQQKVVLAKWLIGSARVFLFDEPTRGIDVGSKYEIYVLMLALLKAGAAIIMVSSELPEVLGMSHRIAVVRAGRIVTTLPRAEATPDRVIAAAAGTAA